MKKSLLLLLLILAAAAAVRAAENAAPAAPAPEDVVDLEDDEEEISPAPSAPVTADSPSAAAAPEPAETTAPAPAEPVEPVPAAAAPQLREEGVDEIDLEEMDDSAEAAKKPRILAAGESVEYVDISCDEATLADILRQFRKTTSANIICDDSTNLQKRVSAELKHVPWLDALQSILRSRGFRLEERGNIYFVNEDKVVEPLITKTFQLNHASSDELATLFNESYGHKDNSGKIVGKIANSFPEANVVVVTAKEKTIADCEAIVKSVDHAVAQIYIEARFLELSSEAEHALGLDWKSLKSWGVSIKNVSAGLTHSYGRPADYGTGLTSKSLSSSTTSSESDSGSNSSSASSDGTSSASTSSSPSTSKNLSDSVSQTFTGLFPSSIGSAAKEAISAADMAWNTAYGYSGQLSADEFSLALSAFETLGEGKVFSNPKIIVANGKEAKVDMTTKEPNVTVEASYTGTSSQNMNISTKLETIPGNDKLMFAGEAFFSYGITLSVKPRISPDGLINVEIVPTISEWASDKEIKGASDQAVYTSYPKINVKRLTTNFTMKDGATAVIGGLTQTVEKDVDDGIPYLRKIPWIGDKLFGHKSRVKQQSEIIVFVTVGIANPQELPKDIGLPTNAVMGREYVEGSRLEPGFRGGSAAEVLAIDTRSLEEINATPPRRREEKTADAPSAETRGTVTIKPSAAPSNPGRPENTDANHQSPTTNHQSPTPAGRARTPAAPSAAEDFQNEIDAMED